MKAALGLLVILGSVAAGDNPPLVSISPGLWHLHQQMDSNGKTFDRQICIRKEELAMPFKPFRRFRCNYTIATSTNKQQLEVFCPGDEGFATGNFQLNVVNSESFRATFEGYSDFSGREARLSILDQKLIANRVSPVCPASKK